MEQALTLSKYFEEANINYMTGACTRLWDTWRFDNVMPGYNKFYYVVDGEFYLKINNQEFIAKKGQLFLLPYNSSQTYYHISKKYATKYWAHFTMPYRDKDLMELITLPIFISVEDDKYISGIFEKMSELDKIGSIEASLRQKSCLFELMAYYIAHSKLTDTKEVLNNEKIADVITYIEQHLNEQLTIDSLSKIMHLHPNYFIRYFKEAIGQSPMEYIRDLRVEHAQQLLQAETTPIQNIATQLGFKSSYYFSRVFKKRTGFTPSVYRLISSSKPQPPTEK